MIASIIKVLQRVNLFKLFSRSRGREKCVYFQLIVRLDQRKTRIALHKQKHENDIAEHNGTALKNGAIP